MKSLFYDLMKGIEWVVINIMSLIVFIPTTTFVLFDRLITGKDKNMKEFIKAYEDANDKVNQTWVTEKSLLKLMLYTIYKFHAIGYNKGQILKIKFDMAKEKEEKDMKLKDSLDILKYQIYELEHQK